MKSLEGVVRDVKRIHDYTIPIIGVINQCDQLDPPTLNRLPIDNEEKNANITNSTGTLEEKLRAHNYLKDKIAG